MNSVAVNWVSLLISEENC